MIIASPLLAAALLPSAAVFAGRAIRLAGPALLTAVTKATWASLGVSVVLALLGASGKIAIEATGLALSLLISFVGALVLSFSARHMKADPDLAGYASRVAILISAVLMLVVAKDVFLFGFAWVASGVLLAKLIGHVSGWVEAEAARKRAQVAFLIGDSALLAALVILAGSAGSPMIADILSAAPVMPWPLAILVAALLLLAATARSALPPFHKWRMGSMTAPTPVSALMHAGIVNAGGFLLIRFAPVLEATPSVKAAAVFIGAFGALFGVGVMIVRPDIKRALGGSTVAQMSFMIMTCGMGAYALALWHLVAHGLFKSWAFFSAGSAIATTRNAELLPWKPSTAIMAGGFGLAVLIAALGFTGAIAQPLPVVLAMVGAATAFAGLVRAHRANIPALSITAIGLVGAYVAGAVLVERLSGLPHGTTPISTSGQLVLLAAFLLAWVWQAARWPIPPALYVRLLNTGGPALIR